MSTSTCQKVGATQLHPWDRSSGIWNLLDLTLTISSSGLFICLPSPIFCNDWFMQGHQFPLCMVSSFPQSTAVWKKVILLTSHQVNRSLALCHRAVSFAPPHHIMKAFYHPTSPQEGLVQYKKIFRETDHVHLTFITVYCCNCLSYYYLLLLISDCA